MNIELMGQQIARTRAECEAENLWTWIYVMSSAITALCAAIVYLFHKLMKCMKGNRAPWNHIDRRNYDDAE